MWKTLSKQNVFSVDNSETTHLENLYDIHSEWGTHIFSLSI